MKQRFKKYKVVLIAPFIAIGILCLVLFATPVAFSAVREDIRISRIWIGLSFSADVYGTTGIFILLSLFLASKAKGIFVKLSVFFINLVMSLLCLGLLAATNEYVIKPLTHIPRPSQRYLADSSHKIINLKDLYSMKTRARGSYIRKSIIAKELILKNIPAPVLNAWESEAGYSFPSGHSQNAFLISTILCYILYEIVPKPRKWVAFLPFIWGIMVCLSRVALGVHSVWDVSGGALQGTIVGLLFVVSGLYEKWYFVKYINKIQPGI